MKKDLPILFFKDEKAWAKWLAKNHKSAEGIWLQIAKKDSDVRSVTYAEALEVALCYGWIDGQKSSHDQATWLQRFTPRGPRSVWSKINREKALKLIEDGKMRKAGLATIEAAKKNGKWETAYEPQKTATVPDDLQAALDKNSDAKAFFSTLKGANRYAVIYRVQTAKKPETRAKRIEMFIRMLKEKKTVHS